MSALTDPQRRYLAAIIDKPGRGYNGRARRTVEALAVAGLITYEHELLPSSGTWSERYACTATDAGRALAARLGPPPPAPPTARELRRAARDRAAARIRQIKEG